MTEIIDTIQNSINELIGSAVKILPALISALIIIALTRYGAEFTQRVAKKVSEKNCQKSFIATTLFKINLYSYLDLWGGNCVYYCFSRT